jgi:hypothetical protein
MNPVTWLEAGACAVVAFAVLAFGVVVGVPDEGQRPVRQVAAAAWARARTTTAWLAAWAVTLAGALVEALAAPPVPPPAAPLAVTRLATAYPDWHTGDFAAFIEDGERALLSALATHPSQPDRKPEN